MSCHVTIAAWAPWIGLPQAIGLSYSQQRTVWFGEILISSGSSTVQISRLYCDAGQAARRKPAAGRQVDQVGHRAGDDVRSLLGLAQDGDRADQARV